MSTTGKVALVVGGVVAVVVVLLWSGRASAAPGATSPVLPPPAPSRALDLLRLIKPPLPPTPPPPHEEPDPVAELVKQAPANTALPGAVAGTVLAKLLGPDAAKIASGFINAGGVLAGWFARKLGMLTVDEVLAVAKGAKAAGLNDADAKKVVDHAKKLRADGKI